MPERSDIPDFTLMLRGYDRRQVDDYLRRLTRDLDDAHGRALSAERSRPSTSGGSFAELGPHVTSVLQRATEEADQLRREAAASADQVRAQAERAAKDLTALAGSEAATAGAQRDALLAEARSRADELLQRAQRHADQRSEQTVAAAAQEVQHLRLEVAALSQARDEVLDQVRAAGHRLLAAAQAGAPGAVGLRPVRDVSA